MEKKKNNENRSNKHPSTVLKKTQTKRGSWNEISRNQTQQRNHAQTTSFYIKNEN